MDWLQVIILSAVWFFAGYSHGKASSLKSNAHKFATRLITDLAALHTTLRFVGRNPNIVATTTSEWEAGKLGKFKVTLEPVAAHTAEGE